LVVVAIAEIRTIRHRTVASVADSGETEALALVEEEGSRKMKPTGVPAGREATLQPPRVSIPKSERQQRGGRGLIAGHPLPHEVTLSLSRKTRNRSRTSLRKDTDFVSEFAIGVIALRASYGLTFPAKSSMHSVWN